ncbi:MAG: PilZ domain-containing protein [bacterium]
MANKRQLKRYIKRCSVEFSSNGVPYRGISSDFSLKGLFIRTSHPLATGTVFGLVIYLPDGSAANLTGKVKRAQKTPTGRVIGTPVKAMKNGMGVEIIKHDINYLHFIRSLL